MASYFDVGDKAPQALGLITVSVSQGDSVILKNISGDTISYFKDTTSTAAGTVAATASTTFTAPAWIQSAGRSSVSLTGGKF